MERRRFSRQRLRFMMPVSIYRRMPALILRAMMLMLHMPLDTCSRHAMLDTMHAMPRHAAYAMLH